MKEIRPLLLGIMLISLIVYASPPGKIFEKDSTGTTTQTGVQEKLPTIGSTMNYDLTSENKDLNCSPETTTSIFITNDPQNELYYTSLEGSFPIKSPVWIGSYSMGRLCTSLNNTGALLITL
jgi:hypothetical protein